MYVIERNGRTNLDFDILVKERPAIPSPDYDYDSYRIPGRDGDIYKKRKTVRDVTILISFTFKANPDEWQDKFRAARRWLLSNDDNVLRLSDLYGYFYKVKRTAIKECEREVIRIGEFSAEFICSGYQYFNDGLREINLSELRNGILYNPYNLCRPIYIIEGNGECDLTVNGYKFDATVNGKLFIDSDLIIAYNEQKVNQSNVVTGDYERLHLKEADNSLNITDGFNLKIIPNWRCV